MTDRKKLVGQIQEPGIRPRNIVFIQENPEDLIQDFAAGDATPMGAVLGGRPFGEERLLAVAAAYQQATDWHARRPPDPDGVGPPEPGRPPGRRRIDASDVMELSE